MSLGGCATLPASTVRVAATPAPSADAAEQRSLHLVGGRWFDGERFVTGDWYVVDGRFTAARPARIDATLNLADRYILPPFAEAHNHDLQNAFTASMNAQAYLDRGVFYSAQLCSMPDETRGYRGLFASTASIDVLFAGGCISASDGHPLGIALASYKAEGMPVEPDSIRNKGYWSIDTRAELDARWDAIAADKPKLIKIILIDSANHAANRKRPELFGYNGLDPALVPEIVARAKAIGARVAAHVDTASDFDAAVRGGVAIIAHLPGYRIAKGHVIAEYRLSDAAIAEAARRGVFVTPTVAVARHHLRANPGDRDAIMANHADNIRRLRAAGVKLILGSDLFGGSVLDEVEAIDALGIMPRAELLRIATRDTAREIFPDRRIGIIEEGAEASFIALDGDPLTDLTAIRRIRAAVKQGNVLAR
jgi:hypothetical protein